MNGLWDIVGTIVIIVFTWAGVILLDRYVFNKHRHKNRKKR